MEYDKRRLNIFIILAVLSLLPSASTAAPAKAEQHKIRWLLGHANLDYFEEAAASFKAAVEKGSGGDIAVEIVLADNPWEDTLGRTTPEVAAKVMAGEAAMGHSFTNVMGNLDQRLWVFDLPYLFNGYRHVEGVVEGPVGAELLAGLRAHGLEGLAFTFSGGAQGVATKERELRSPEDLSGLRVGVTGHAVDQAWLKALGATPVPIGHRVDKLGPMAANGSVDAAVLTWRRAQELRLHEGFRFMSLMSSSYLVSVTYVNAKFFDGLPLARRALLRDAALAAARVERARTIELNEVSRREMTLKGIVAVPLLRAGQARFSQALGPVYAQSLERIVGKDLIERVKATPPGRHPAAFDVSLGK